LEIVTTHYSNADMPPRLNQTTSVLDANPDLVGIFGANEPTAIGMGPRLPRPNSPARSPRLVSMQQRSGWLIKDEHCRRLLFSSSYNMGYGRQNCLRCTYNVRKLKNMLHWFPDGYQRQHDSQEAKNVLY
jgi:ribose transport system substrate-binding protein